MNDIGGIVESNLLTEYGRAFDLTTSTGYAELLAFWTQTHFFLLAGGQTEWFEAADPRPTDSHDARFVVDSFPDSRIIVITRNDVDTVRSKIRLDSRRGIRTSPFRGGASQGVQSRQLRVFRRRPGVLTLSTRS